MLSAWNWLRRSKLSVTTTTMSTKTAGKKEIIWNPELKLYRIDRPQRHVCKKEEDFLVFQWLCTQDLNCSMDREDPEELHISQEEGGQLVLKQQTDSYRPLRPVLKEEEEESPADQRLCNQEMDSSIKREDPEPPMKEELGELHISQEGGGQLILKQETDTYRPQRRVCKEEEEEEFPVSQRLCHQDLNSSMDREDPEPPQKVQEQEELHISQEEGGQLVLKQQTDSLCSRSRHKSCAPETEPSSDGSTSDEDFIPDASSSSDCDERPAGIQKAKPTVSESSTKTKNVPHPVNCAKRKGRASNADNSRADEDLQPTSSSRSNHYPTRSNTRRLTSVRRTVTECHSDEEPVTETSPNPEDSSCTHKNYCYYCNKAQSKISRHLLKHAKEEPEVAEAFSLPKHSKERKRLLERLRNEGNYRHNREALESHSGPLKLKRRPTGSNVSLNAKAYVHCVYCKGMFARKELWRHLYRCPSKTVKDAEAAGRAKVLLLVDMAESKFFHAVSPGVWKILGNMRRDEVGFVSRNDLLLLQMCQGLYKKHGNDPVKFEYIRQKVREMGRLLLCLRNKYSLCSFEDAVKPDNFRKVVEAVRDVAGYDEEKHSYRTPSLAVKLGHSLRRIGDIVLCRAMAAEDNKTVKAAQRFRKLCSKEWTELVSPTGLATVGVKASTFHRPSTIPFTRDVQLLHEYLERKSAAAVENLKSLASPRMYAKLARVTLVQTIVFNRGRSGDVSKMTLDSFKRRSRTERRGDIAVGLSPFEQELARHFSRVEITGKRRRKVAILLTPELVSAITLFVGKRDACGVDRDNPFLFGRPRCHSASVYRGQACMRIYASKCGAKNPSHLRSALLRKHVATLCQILNLEDDELRQLANFLGHDIRAHRDFYRLPEATVEMAKISKLLLAMEKGCLAQFQGKSLDQIEIEDELEPDLADDGEEDQDDDDDDDDEHDEDSDPARGQRGKRRKMELSHGEAKGSKAHTPLETRGGATSSKEIRSRRCVKRPWGENEVNAVMKHFSVHISKGQLASRLECERCKLAEDPVLRKRTIQKIRDFVRNRGLVSKRKSSRPVL